MTGGSSLSLAEKRRHGATDEALRHQQSSSGVSSLPFGPVSHPLGGKQVPPVATLGFGDGTVLVVKPGVEQKMAIFVSESHPQAIAAMALLP